MEDHLAPIILAIVFGGAMIVVYAMLLTAAVRDGQIERHHRRSRR